MANKKIGIYGKLESTANNKVENLYIIVNNKSILFIVKHLLSNEFISVEHFEKEEDSTPWKPLFAFLQNHSSLIQNYYKNIYFVNNSNRVILSQTDTKDDALLAAQELELIHGYQSAEEIYTSAIGEKHFLIYGVNDELSALLTRYFHNGKWQHYASFFLQNVSESEVQIRIFEDYFMVYIVENGKTKLLNYFSLGVEDQNIYTVLNACSNAGIDINNFSMTVWGFDQQHNFIEKLRPYFSSIHIKQVEQLPNTYSSYLIF